MVESWFGSRGRCSKQTVDSSLKGVSTSFRVFLSCPIYFLLPYVYRSETTTETTIITIYRRWHQVCCVHECLNSFLCFSESIILLSDAFSHVVSFFSRPMASTDLSHTLYASRRKELLALINQLRAVGCVCGWLTELKIWSLPLVHKMTLIFRESQLLVIKVLESLVS